ncbi:MAG: penicillin-binding protein 2 [Terriglobales bacterium]
MLGGEEKIPQGRLLAVQYGLLIIFLGLAFGLWRLQVMGSDRYGLLAERNRIRTVPILAPRGKILDREGRILVDNYPSFSALLLREQKLTDEELEKIASGLNLTPEQVRERLRKGGRAAEFQPVILKDDITPDELAFIDSHRNELPQLETIVVHRRLYPRNGFAAHLIGYVGEVSEEMLNQPQYELYSPGDVVGRSGVEQSYNALLMGTDGSRRVIVNSRGREEGRLEEKPAQPGKPLRLTLDLDLQIAAEQALEGRNGAVVALDPRTGEVLALASRPTFDPNRFAVRISREEWNQLITDPAKPLLNKAVQAQLPPGSVFKIIMSVAGLEEGVAQTLVVNCAGGRIFYGRFFKCHSVHGAGVEITRAIPQSCDTFFYTLAERLGISRIAKYAMALGLGRRTGIDLPQEAAGVMPSEEWKARTFKQKWYAGETISVGIGQGAVTTTPIQLVYAIGGIASGGVLRRPHVAFPQDLPPELRPVSDAAGEQRVPIDPKNWELITDAMAGVVNPGGTAAGAHLEGIDFAGKTGSAQVVSNEAKQKQKLIGEQFKDNGWFVGVEPRRNPEIAVCVLVEQGEHGSLSARLVAQIIKAYVEKKRGRETKLARRGSSSVEVAALWEMPSEAGGAKLGGGRFRVPVGRARAQAAAPQGAP